MRRNHLLVVSVLMLFLCSSWAFGLTKVGKVDTGRLIRMEYVNFPDPDIPSSDPTFQRPLAEGTFDFFVSNVNPDFNGVAYLNVFAELNPWAFNDNSLEWIVKNIPYQVPDCITAPSHSIWINPREFDKTGQNDIWPGNPYEVWACLTDEEMLQPPGFNELEIFDFCVMPAGVEFWGLYDTLHGLGQIESQPLLISTEPAKTTGKKASSNKGTVTMPDITQKPMECGPTSAANSIRWLAETHGFNDKLPKKNDDLIKDLMKAMTGSNQRPFSGLSGDQLRDGKVKYAQEKKLPIMVEGGMNDPNASGSKAFDFIKKEFDEGNDIEFLIGWPGGNGSHWVTVTGYKVNGNRLFLTVNDPDDGKTGSVTWELDRNGNFIKPRGKMLWAVSESYKAPVSSSSLNAGQ